MPTALIGPIIGGVASIGSSLIGAKAQKKAVNKATGNVAPFVSGGALSQADFNQLMGSGGAGPFSPSALLHNPIYQSLISEGQKGIYNGYAAKGQGVSGAAMKGASDYAQTEAGKYLTGIAGLLQGNINSGATAAVGIAPVQQQAGYPITQAANTISGVANRFPWATLFDGNTAALTSFGNSAYNNGNYRVV